MEGLKERMHDKRPSDRTWMHLPYSFSLMPMDNLMQREWGWMVEEEAMFSSSSWNLISFNQSIHPSLLVFFLLEHCRYTCNIIWNLTSINQSCWLYLDSCCGLWTTTIVVCEGGDDDDGLWQWSWRGHVCSQRCFGSALARHRSGHVPWLTTQERETAMSSMPRCLHSSHRQDGERGWRHVDTWSREQVEARGTGRLWASR